MVTRQNFQRASLNLSYLEWNQGSEPLLLLHGMADHALVWSNLGDDLQSQYHIIAPDLRGHGDSSKPESGYRFEDYIEDLTALMAHLGWTSAHFLGHSWAVKILTLWIKQSPQLFKSLIFVDPVFIQRFPRWFKITFPIFYKGLPFLRAMGPFNRYETAEKFARRLKQYRGWSPLQEQVFKAGIERKKEGTWGSKFTIAARNEIFNEVMLYDGLTEEITIPTLLIKPEQGLNRTAWQLRSFCQYFKNLQILEVSGNHWVFLEHSAEFNRIVAQFLQQQGDSDTKL